MIISDNLPRSKGPPHSGLYIRAWSGEVSPEELCQAIQYAIRHGLAVPQPATGEQYLRAREAFPNHVPRWHRHQLQHCGIVREARDVEDRLADNDVNPLPHRVCRRMVATLSRDPELCRALRDLIAGGMK